MASRCFTTCLIVLFIVSAVPLSFIIALERRKSWTHSYEYHSHGWLRECSRWDDLNRRFIVSYLEGGVGQIDVPQDHLPGSVLEEKMVIRDADLGRNSSVGILIDRPRNRLLVAVADWKRNSYGALAAYDLTTWGRIFLTHLSGPGDEKSLADDVTVDGDGIAYITDAKSNKIWKVGLDGELLSVIRSPLFHYQRKEWYYNLIGLNGIVYHPNGFLLVVHTTSGYLFKIDVGKEEVTKVDVEKGSLFMGDGLVLLSPTKLVVAGTPCRLVESLDRWKTATVVGRYVGPMHRHATSVTVKDGKVYLSHMIGGGLPKRKHVITEAVFSPLN